MKIYTIYKVTNIITGKSYIGFSSDWKSRKRIHKFNALSAVSRNYIFYNSIRKYGINQFEWEVIYQSLNKLHTLEEMEDYFIREYNTIHPNGYNMKSGGSGGNLSEDAKKKISESRKGMVFSDEHRLNLSLSHKGNVLSEETKRKLSISNKGKNKGKLPWCTGKKFSSSLKGTKKPYIKKNRCSCIICRQEISNNHITIHYKKHYDYVK